MRAQRHAAADRKKRSSPLGADLRGKTQRRTHEPGPVAQIATVAMIALP
jgi:hypothetical protein